MRVLIAEDDASTADLYRQVLQDRGHAVTVASCGEQCLRIYSEELTRAKTVRSIRSHMSPFDSVIIDYKLPDINGLEVAKEILTLNPHQRIIFLSAYASEILAQGADNSMISMEVLAKPISNKDLVEAVEDSSIFDDLKKFHLNIDSLKEGGSSYGQPIDIVDNLRRGRSSDVI